MGGKLVFAAFFIFGIYISWGWYIKEGVSSTMKILPAKRLYLRSIIKRNNINNYEKASNHRNRSWFCNNS